VAGDKHHKKTTKCTRTRGHVVNEWRLQGCGHAGDCGVRERDLFFFQQVAKLTSALEALPDPSPQLAALRAQGVALLAANGQLTAQLAAAVGEADAVKGSLHRLSHEFKTAGYCKASDLADAEGRLKHAIDTCQVCPAHNKKMGHGPT
jgi:hypothetical protein